MGGTHYDAKRRARDAADLAEFERRIMAHAAIRARCERGEHYQVTEAAPGILFCPWCGNEVRA